MLTCPPITDWQRLLRGDLADGDADTLETHLDGCNTCRTVVGGLKIDDSLVKGLPKKGSSTGDEDLLPGLIQRLKGVVHSSSGTNLITGQAAEDLEQLRVQLADGSRVGNHRVIRHLATGGMGVVFEGEDEELKRRVAIKLMKPALAANGSARARFFREGRVMASLDHPHVVRIHQIAETNGWPYFVMEFISGETLAGRLQRTPRPTPSEIASIGRQIALALAAAHERGIIHRDIKPGNVFLVSGDGSSNPVVKVVDFGLARVMEIEPGCTRPGDVLGTPDYMSPEQARGQRIDARSDLFSLGCVLYELCTGFTPFQAMNSSPLSVGMEAQWPRPISDLNPSVPVGLEKLIAKLLARQPDDRPSSADEVAKELHTLESAEPPKAIVRPIPPVSKVQFVVPAIFVTLAIVSLLVLTVFFTKDPPLTGSWTEGVPLEQARINAMAAELNGVVYLAAGDPTKAGDLEPRRLDTLEAFHPETGTWKSLAPMKRTDDGENGRSAGSLGVIDGKLYLAGGWRHKTELPTQKGLPTRTLLVYDPRTNTWDIGRNMPEPGGDSVGGVIGRKFYVLSGTNGNDGLRRLFFAYDAAKESWEERQPPLRFHSQGAAGVIGGKLYVAGGATGQGATGGLDVYDPEADAWDSFAPMPTPRVSPAAAVMKGHLVVLGGNDDKGNQLATVEAYNPKTNRWTRLPDLPEGRQGAAAAVVGHKLYVMGGQRLGVNLASVDVFTLSAKSR